MSKSLRGSIFADSLTGDQGVNELRGDDGDDLLDGKAGADLLAGGDGNDTYMVDDAGDIVDEIGGSGIDIVRSAVSFSLTDDLNFRGEIENLTLLGSAAINGTGNALANLIVGNTGANQLDGLAGNDTISGGAGRDVLSGGDGTDRFTFDAGLNKKTNVDRITDFDADDVIVLDGGLFAKLKLGALKGKAFHEGRKAHDGNDRIVYNDKNGKLIYDATATTKAGRRLRQARRGSRSEQGGLPGDLTAASGARGPAGPGGLSRRASRAAGPGRRRSSRPRGRSSAS